MKASFQFLIVSLLAWSAAASDTQSAERRNHFSPQDYESSEVLWIPVKDEPCEEERAMSTFQPSEKALQAHEWLLKAIEGKIAEKKSAEKTRKAGSGALQSLSLSGSSCLSEKIQAPRRSKFLLASSSGEESASDDSIVTSSNRIIGSDEEAETEKSPRPEKTKETSLKRPREESEETRAVPKKSRSEEQKEPPKKTVFLSRFSSDKISIPSAGESEKPVSQDALPRINLRAIAKSAEEKKDEASKGQPATPRINLRAIAKSSEGKPLEGRMSPNEAPKMPVFNLMPLTSSTGGKTSGSETQPIESPQDPFADLRPPKEPRKSTTILEDSQVPASVLAKLPNVMFRSETEKAAASDKRPIQFATRKRQPTLFGGRDSVANMSIRNNIGTPSTKPAEQVIRKTATRASAVQPVSQPTQTASPSLRTSATGSQQSLRSIAHASETQVTRQPEVRIPPKPAGRQFISPVRTQRLHLPTEVKAENWDVYRHSAPNTARIVVFNLAQSITSDQLLTAFKTFGRISSIQIIDDHTHFRRPSLAFIEFDVQKSAELAVHAMAGKKIGESTVGVDFSTESFDRHTRILVVKFTDDWKFVNASEKFKLLSVTSNTQKFGPVLFSHYDPVIQKGLIVFNFIESAAKYKKHLSELEFPLQAYHP